MRLLSAVLDLLFPPRCPFCDRLLRDGERPVCERCRRELPVTEGGRAEQKPEFVRLCVSPLWYQGAVRSAVHRYKFTGRRDYAGALGALLADCVRERLDGEYDLLTWVPLSARRKRRRGYDQVYLMAKALGGELGLSPTETLTKVRHNPPQSGLEEDGARRANVMGAYRVKDGLSLTGKRVLLVDDVVTTGATLSECARVLRTAGAEQVVCVTLARARG